VDQPARRKPWIDSPGATALTVAALSGMRDGNDGPFFSAESRASKVSATVSGMAPSHRRRENFVAIGRRTYCLPSSTLSELRDRGGELCV
jgi:hypothetical protein